MIVPTRRACMYIRPRSSRSKKCLDAFDFKKFRFGPFEWTVQVAVDQIRDDSSAFSMRVVKNRIISRKESISVAKILVVESS